MVPGRDFIFWVVGCIELVYPNDGKVLAGEFMWQGFFLIGIFAVILLLMVLPRNCVWLGVVWCIEFLNSDLCGKTTFLPYGSICREETDVIMWSVVIIDMNKHFFRSAATGLKVTRPTL